MLLLKMGPEVPSRARRALPALRRSEKEDGLRPSEFLVVKKTYCGSSGIFFFFVFHPTPIHYSWLKTMYRTHFKGVFYKKKIWGKAHYGTHIWATQLKSTITCQLFPLWGDKITGFWRGARILQYIILVNYPKFNNLFITMTSQCRDLASKHFFSPWS